MDIRESELRTTAMFDNFHQAKGKNGEVTGMTKIDEEEYDEDFEEDEDAFFGDLGIGSHDSDNPEQEEYSPPDIEDQIEHIESVLETKMNKESIMSPILPKAEKLLCIRKRLGVLPQEYIMDKVLKIYIPKTEQGGILKNTEDNIEDRFEMLIDYEKNKNNSITILKEIQKRIK